MIAGQRDRAAGANTIAVALMSTLGLAALGWLGAVRRMSGMDMGAATDLGPLTGFLALWAPMMAAMMLPGVTPAALKTAPDGIGAVLRFVGSYLAVWTLIGFGVYVLYRPHGTFAAGVLVIVAGCYELTPVKRHFRRRCREHVRSGFDFGRCCVGSTLGLMAVPLALDPMSVPWMVLVALIALEQKLVPANAGVDATVALALVGLGLLIIISPGLVPALTPLCGA